MIDATDYAIYSDALAAQDTPAESDADAIDVLVVYPQPAEEQMETIIRWNRNWAQTEIGPFLNVIFEQTTNIYRASSIDATFRVVHSQQIDYAHIDPDWQPDLSLALMNSEGGNQYYQ